MGKNTGLIIAVAMIYAVLGVLGFITCIKLYPYTGGADGLKNFGVAATVVVALISGAMTTVVSLYTLHYNNLNQTSIKHLETQLARQREFDTDAKAAYRALLSAGTAASFRLKKLETGSWTSKDSEKMEEALWKPAYRAAYLKDDEKKWWHLVQHRAVDIAGHATKLTDATKQPGLWRDMSAPFAEAFATFTTIAESGLRRGTEQENDKPAA